MAACSDSAISIPAGCCTPFLICSTSSARFMYLMMTHPWEFDGTVERAEETFRKIKIPFYTGSGAYAYTYKLHWLGAQHYFQNVDAPKKLLFTGPAHLERPFHQYHDEIIRWYDHWLKGQDTGIMDEPPVRYWLMGAN